MADLAHNRVYLCGCLEGLRQLSDGSVPLVFVDPPAKLKDQNRVSDRAYLSWATEWLSEIFRVLTPMGTLWLAARDHNAAELKILMQHDIGFHFQNWIIWYDTFGPHCKRRFAPSHTHLFQMTRDARKFTFNADDPKVRIPLARQTRYQDKRANAKSRLPDNTWLFSRTPGRFNERQGEHCPMPELLLGRIIRTSSNPGELVLDPFAGNGTALVTAKKLGREYLGFDISEPRQRRAEFRLRNCSPWDPLVGESPSDYTEKLFDETDAAPEEKLEDGLMLDPLQTKDKCP